jgi:hypothetical protein
VALVEVFLQFSFSLSIFFHNCCGKHISFT